MINLHIIGVQKSGTSALAHFLHQHPDIYVVDGKEAHVFDHPDFLRSNNKMAWAKQRYANLRKDYQGEAYCCDATPITCFHPSAMKHCVNYNPNAKFILLLREQVDRAVSHYKMSYQRGQESLSMFNAFRSEARRLAKLNPDNENWPMQSPMRNHSYLLRGLYKEQIARVQSLVPNPDNLLIMWHHDLLNKHKQSLEQVFTFLGLRSVDIPQQKVFANPGSKTSADEILARLYAKYWFWRNKSRLSDVLKLLQ